MDGWVDLQWQMMLIQLMIFNKCGGFRQRANRAQATADFRALRNFEDIQWYRQWSYLYISNKPIFTS